MTACSSNQEVIMEKPVTLESLKQTLNEEREKAVQIPLKDNGETYKMAMNAQDFSQEEVKTLLESGQVSNVTKEQAIEDAKTLYKILRTSYAGYKYFGGDDTFDKALEETVQEIKSCGHEIIAPGELENILLRHLSFLKDTHFRIGIQNTPADEAYTYYANWGADIKEDTKGYYSEINNEKWYLDETMNSYLKYTVSETGEIVYGLFALAVPQEKASLPKKIMLTHGDENKTYDIMWRVADAGKPPEEEYIFNVSEDIPIVSLRTLMFDEPINAFINDAKSLKDEEAVILDIRQNGGGIPELNYMWLYNLTHEVVYPKMSVFLNSSSLNFKVQKQQIANAGFFKDYDALDFTKAHHDIAYEIENQIGCSLRDIPQPGMYAFEDHSKWIQKDNTLFVAFDKNTYSAAEEFINQAETMSNTILVGTNSNGCLTTGLMNVYQDVYLPHSKLPIYYGSQLYVTDHMKDYDVKGSQPDIYIADEDAVEAIQRCYSYYKDQQ